MFELDILILNAKGYIMKLIKGIKQLFIISIMVALAACAHKRPYSQQAVNYANAAYNQSDDDARAQSSGIGEGAQFNDTGRRGHLLSKRIYYFDFDSNVVHSEDKPAIIANANYLVAHPNAKVMLEGHTDPRGSREYNIGLGERRAKAVANILTSNGVNRSQIRIVSYGAQKLASMGHTESDYQLDRRVVLVYLQR